MKKLLFIFLFWLSYCQAQEPVSINGSGNNVAINTGNNDISINAWKGLIIDDDGYYNAFPMIGDARGDSTCGIYKKASGHAPAGVMPLVKTTNRGKTWAGVNIKVDGNEIISTNHSFLIHSSGRLLLSYRVSGVIYFAYNDNWDENFTSSATTLTPGANNLYAQSPIKMVEMPSGNVLFCYYQVGSNGNPAIGSLMESDDIGETYTFKCNIYSHNSPATNPTLGDWRGNEVAIAITQNTGVDATCKMIAIVRTEVADIGGTFPMFFYSADGGATWTTDAVNRDPGSFVDENGVLLVNNSPGFSRQLVYTFVGTNSPFDIRLHNGLIYVVNGERNRTGSNKYALKYSYATPDNSYVNIFSNWFRLPFQTGAYYHASVAGATVDCGYPVIFKAGGYLYVAQYDVSTQAPDPLKAETRGLVEFTKLTN